MLNNSDHQAVLLLGNLVEGKYTFTLTVTDSKGQTSTDHGSVEVKPGQSPRSSGFDPSVPTVFMQACLSQLGVCVRRYVGA